MTVADVASGAPAKGLARSASLLKRRGRDADGLVSARLARFLRLFRFALVGAAGLVVNEAALAIVLRGTDLPAWSGPIIATQCSTVFAFLLIEHWAFRAKSHDRPLWHRFGMFWAINNVALLGRSPIIVGLSAGFGMDILWSNLVSLGVLTLVRFFIADSIIWGNKAETTTSPASAESFGLLLPIAGDSPRETLAPDTTDTTDGRTVPCTERQSTDVPPEQSAERRSTNSRISSIVGYARSWESAPRVALVAILAVAMFVRVWAINALGYNSDEIVYVTQGASIAGDPGFTQSFPIFRAHPLLFQLILSVLHQVTSASAAPRLAAAAFGVASVVLVFAIGRRLYGVTSGLIAAGILALMPYHVVVSRQVLLDGPMVCLLLLSMYALVRFAESGHSPWLYATSAALGLSFLTKETAIVNVGIIVIFFALTPTIRIRLRHAAGAAALFGALIVVFPLAIRTANAANNKGQSFLLWQLVRRPNHTFSFYLDVVPPAIGWFVVGLAVFAIATTVRERTWREVLLLAWILVPVAFFALWPVKGYQYLLPAAPAIALLAARAVDLFAHWPRLGSNRVLAVCAVPVVLIVLAASLAVPTWRAIDPSSTGALLAGSGGLPGGRETGTWIDAHVPEGTQLLALGPSMANVVEYYGHRRTYGLSVSTNPLHRNPVYVPLSNPDLAMREGRVQYLVWDSYTAGRSSFYSTSLLRYVHRYRGTAVHIVRADPHDPKSRPVIVVYELQP